MANQFMTRIVGYNGAGLICLPNGGTPPQSANFTELSPTAGPGSTNSAFMQGRLTTAIADSTATTVATITIPNAAHSALIDLLCRTGMTNTSHIYDSTRVQRVLIAVTRVPGAAAVAVASSAIGAAIATSSGGQTMTSTLSLASVSGGNTVTQTINIQITNVGTPSATSECQVFWNVLNSQINGVTVS